MRRPFSASPPELPQRVLFAATFALASACGSVDQDGAVPGSAAAGTAGIAGTAGGTGQNGGAGGSAGASGAPAGGLGGSSTGGTGNVSSGGSQSSGCTSLPPVSPRLWRLSARQYSNAVRDVLGLAAGPELVELGGENPLAFIADDALTVNYPMLNGMYVVLEPVLDGIMSGIPALTACSAGEAEDACARRFVESFGKKAFRRALAAPEIDALMVPYAEGVKESFATGIRLVIQALLLSPSFLFRTELGTPAEPARLSSDEVASQLSFLLLNSVPDAELLAASASGGLTTPDGIAREVDRLLALPAVRSNLTRIVADWFNVRGISEHPKATSYFAGLEAPAGTDIVTAVKTDLTASTQAFLTDVMWSGSGDLGGFLTSTKIFVNPRLATLYGFTYPGTGGEFVAVDAPADQRAGILTQPGIIWTNSGSQTTSIVHRGIFVNKDIVCGDPIPEPPAGLAGSIDAVAMLPTEMEKVTARFSNPQCAGCHSSIDPYGIVLQSLDPIGRYQTETEGALVVDSAEFDVSPTLSGTVEGPVALAQALVADRVFTRCALKKVTGYALGRALEGSSICEIDALLPPFEQNGGSMAALVRAIAVSSFMTSRPAGGAP
ncbi:MAG TPA: DUF1592 domain-containing protein [Polyangiaceae bacterium]